jgi:hypothetical protein
MTDFRRICGDLLSNMPEKMSARHSVTTSDRKALGRSAAIERPLTPTVRIAQQNLNGNL